MSVSGLADNAHVYIHATSVTLGTLNGSGVKYMSTLAPGSYSDVMFHVFKIAGGVTCVDVKALM